MKIRQGFISNSSSTSFMFIFKGETKEDLYDAIWKNRKDFHLVTDDNYSCCAEFLVDAIESNLTIVELGNRVNSIDSIIKDLNKSIADISGYKLDKRTEKVCIDEYNGYIGKLIHLKDKGFKTILQISFGDNHGDISGGNVGTTMDYESYHFENYEKKDLAIITINEH